MIFWAPVHGQAATTSNAIATSLMAGMGFKKKVMLTQTHFNYNNLEAPLVGHNSSNSAHKEYFRDVGLDAIIRCFKAAKIDRSTLENCCISLPNSNMLLLPGTSKSIRESFDYEMEAVMLGLLRAIEEVQGLVFVDISSGDNPLSKKLIANADLVVVNLSQNMGITDLYFEMFKDMMPKNIFYLFGNYDCKSKYNISNIRRKYHKYITATNSGVIPNNTAYLDAQCDGNVVEFIRKNLKNCKNDDNNYFIMKVKVATERILKMAGVNLKAIERA
ncbi:MAG: hypothetical protein ACYDEX_12630 [Mobilitalea sp.]